MNADSSIPGKVGLEWEEVLGSEYIVEYLHGNDGSVLKVASLRTGVFGPLFDKVEFGPITPPTTDLEFSVFDFNCEGDPYKKPQDR